MLKRPKIVIGVVFENNSYALLIGMIDQIEFASIINAIESIKH